MLSKYFVYDDEGFMLRWFYTKAEALHYVDNNNWTIVLKKKEKVDLYKLLGEALI